MQRPLDKSPGIVPLEGGQLCPWRRECSPILPPPSSPPTQEPSKRLHSTDSLPAKHSRLLQLLPGLFPGRLELLWGGAAGECSVPREGKRGAGGRGAGGGGGEGDGCPGLATGIVMRLYSKLRQSSSQCKSCSFGQFRELRGCQHMVRGEKGERGASQIAADGNGWRNVSAHTKPTIRTVKPKRRELRRFLA